MPHRHYVRKHTRRRQTSQPEQPAQEPNRLLDVKQVCAMLSMSKTTLYAMALRGEGPVSVKIGAKRYWSLYAVQAYIARLEEEARNGRDTWGA